MNRSDDWQDGYQEGRRDAAQDVARLPHKVVYVVGDRNQRLLNRDDAVTAALGTA